MSFWDLEFGDVCFWCTYGFWARMMLGVCGVSSFGWLYVLRVIVMPGWPGCPREQDGQGSCMGTNAMDGMAWGCSQHVVNEEGLLRCFASGRCRFRFSFVATIRQEETEDDLLSCSTAGCITDDHHHLPSHTLSSSSTVPWWRKPPSSPFHLCR